MIALSTLWRFGRPHTIIGTTVSLVALWIIARGLFRVTTGAPFVEAAPGSLELTLGGLALTWLACIGANVFIVGLNQLTDVELDRINKPELPLASGTWSARTGWWVVAVALAISLACTALLDSRWLWWTVALSLALGLAYSLPPVRLKRFPFWAAFCIVAVRSLIVNVTLFAHVAGWSGPLLDLPPLVWLLAALMFAYSIAIAWFKDLPDDRGDAAHGVRTLTVRRGKPYVLREGVRTLGLSLVGTIAFALLSGRFGLGAAGWLAVSHAVALAVFLSLARRVDLAQQSSIRRFYLSLWGLFFLEYGLFAVAAWLV